MLLTGRASIITGGSMGIGKAIAKAFLSEGCHCVLAARGEQALAAAVEELAAIGPRVTAFSADVTSEKDVQSLVDFTLEEFHAINILVNCAGILGPVGSLVENDPGAWRQTLAVNVVGTFLCCRAVLPFMIERRQGKIINLSGGGATSPRPRFSAYAAAKAAVVRVTETLAEEVRPYNIQVNAIAPGAIYTRMTEEILAAGTAAGEKEVAEAGRLHKSASFPDQAVALAVFLASEEADGLTGRLISAVWDDWRSLSDRIPEVMGSELYTLRRVTPEEA